jgi:response regulator NasT
MMKCVVIAAAKEKTADTLRRILSPLSSGFRRSPGASGAERILAEEQCGMLVVNTPLTDENGVEFALRTAQRTDIPVLLLVDTASYDEIRYQTSGSGIFVLRRPVSAEMIVQAAQLLITASEKAARYAAEAARLRRRLDDLSAVNRAKLLLIEREKMTEEEAHHALERYAMDHSVGKKEAAQQVIRRYEQK